MSIYGRDTRDIYDLIEYADFAMYELRKTARKATAASKWRDTGTRKLLFCK